jgi:hypothetical protein
VRAKRSLSVHSLLLRCRAWTYLIV